MLNFYMLSFVSHAVYSNYDDKFSYEFCSKQPNYRVQICAQVDTLTHHHNGRRTDKCDQNNNIVQ